MQQSLLTDEQKMFREAVQEFVKRDVLPHHEQWEKDGIERYSTEIVANDMQMLGGRGGGGDSMGGGFAPPQGQSRPAQRYRFRCRTNHFHLCLRKLSA